MKLLRIVLIIIALILVARHVRWLYTSNVELPKMEQVERPVPTSYEGFKVVKMPARIVATVRTEWTLAWASNSGFGPLAWYIFGDNTKRDKIAMTAPVTSEKIAMTAPVTSEEIGEWVYETAFIMPSEWTMDTLPVPNNDDVTLKELPQELKAVWTFSGYANAHAVDKEWKQFSEALTQQWVKWEWSPTLAQYNDPFTPPWMRRNELRVDLPQQ